MRADRIRVLRGLAETWRQRDADNPQGAGADAGAAASALTEALDLAGPFVPDHSVLPRAALDACARLMEACEGTVHPAGTWRTQSVAYHAGKCLRHLGAHLTGTVYDPHTGHLSLAHAAVRALFALELLLEGGRER